MTKRTINCPDCNGLVSIHAPACPHCGCPSDDAETLKPKSFVNAAIFTFILYWFFWFPGLVANIVYCGEASREKERCDQSPEGMTMLTIMFYTLGVGGIILAAIGICIIGIIFIGLTYR